MNLGQNRCRRDREKQIIRAFQRLNRNAHFAELDVVHHHFDPRLEKRSDPRSHREACRLEDIDPVDKFLPNLHHDPRGAVLTDEFSGFPASFRGQTFGILNQRGVRDSIEFGGTDHHRPGERSPPDFIHADNRTGASQDSTIKFPQDSWGNSSLRGCHLDLAQARSPSYRTCDRSRMRAALPRSPRM